METLQRTANRGSVSTGYDVDNSVKLERANSETLQFTFDQAATNLKKNTLSIWFKRTEISVNQGLYQFGDDASGEHTYIRFTSSDDKGFLRGNFGSNVQFLLTTQSFRDTSAWYHLVVAWDTTQSTASDRLKVYLNGSEITAFDTDNRSSVIPLNHDTPNGENGKSVLIGEGVYKISSYIAETHFVDGQALAPTAFGEFDSDSGIWKPKKYTGTHGNNGFYLDFKNSSNLGEDQSGNNHDFTLNNITSADQATDTCTNNFCTFNPLIATSNAPTINEGAMHVAGGGGTWNNAYGSLGAKNGKWYYEYKVTNTEFGFFGASTFPNEADASTSSQFMYDQSFTIGYAAAHYYQRINGSQISNESTGWGTTSTNDIYGLFLNLDDQEFTVARNGSVLSGTLSQPVSLNSAFSNKFVFPCNAQYEDDGGEFNFGGYTLISNTKSYSDANNYGNFVYSPVLSGVNYYALCTKNLAEYG